jgi:hypothetical protein
MRFYRNVFLEKDELTVIEPSLEDLPRSETDESAREV